MDAKASTTPARDRLPASRVLARALVYFVPLAALALGISALIEHAERRGQRRLVAATVQQRMDAVGEALATRFALVVSDLQLLAQSHEVRDFLERPQPLTRDAVARLFAGFSAARGVYDQIRLLDGGGSEQVRVDLRDGVPERVPEAQLQDKAHRYYVAASLARTPGDLYVSPTDLNRERGRIERPLKPVIRFGTPLADGVGRKRAILLVNVLAAELVGAAERAYRGSPGTLWVAGANGELLHAPDPTLEWNLELPERGAATLSQREAGLWGRLSASRGGQYTDPDGRIVTYRKVAPLGTARVSPAETALAESEWAIVSVVTRAELAAAMGEEGPQTAAAAALGLALCALLALATARARLAREPYRSRMKTLSAAVEQSPVSIVITDPQGAIQYVNHRFTEVTGYAPTEVLGRNPRLLKSELTPAETHRELWQTLARGAVWQGEFANRRKDGSLYWESASIRPVTDAAGTIRHIVALKEDVTARKQAEQELLRAREAAEEANRLKTRFLANMSHEIRTPMNGVLGMVTLALGTPLTPQQREWLGTAKESGRALLRLLADILEFSRLECGEVPLEERPFGLRRALESTLQPLAVDAYAKGVEVNLRVGAEVPERVVGDPVRLRQVVTNLVGNAVKFTACGEVVVDLARAPRPAADSGLQLRLTVTDTGPGVDAAQLPHLFESFTQGDASLSRRHGGAGLGLAIVKGIVDRVGGTLEVANRPEGGAAFSCLLPFGILPEQPAEPADAGLRGRRVLVVEGHPTTGELVCALLRESGAEALARSTPRAALEAAALARCDGRPFDVALVGAELHQADGFSLAGALGPPGGPVPRVVMLLAPSSLPGDTARCREIGVAGTVVKPVYRDDLRRALTAALGGEGAAVEGRATPPGPRRPPGGTDRRTLQILVAEDTPVNRKLTKALLARRGWEAVAVEDGEAALGACSHTRFDLILMDVQMPGMDGLEATRRIRAREAGTGRHTPVVALTAHAMAGDRERFLEAGMDDYLAKPVDAEELFRVVERWTGDPLEGAGPPREPAPAATPLHPLLELRSDARGAVVRAFLESCPGERSALRGAILRGDCPAAEFAAHRLAGSAGAVGAQRAVEIARRIEARGRQASLDGVPELYEALEAELGRVCADLEERLDVPATEPARATR